MALYSYQKAPVRYKPLHEDEVVIIVEKRENAPKLTLWDILSAFFTDFKRLLISSKVAGLFIPLALILLGMSIISKQVWPDIEQYIKFNNGYYDTASVALVDGEYIDRASYLSNPGAEYFRTLANDAVNASVLQPDPVANNYQGRFSLSIPKLGLNDLPVQANVESGVEEAYNKVLLNGLAHFKGTGLPVSDIKNNMVIYGHSAGGDYYQRTKDVASVFSRLDEVKIGDEININIDGQTFRYRVTTTKIVAPSDLQIVTGSYNKRTLTLFTCFPKGSNSHRLVAVATPIT